RRSPARSGPRALSRHRACGVRSGWKQMPRLLPRARTRLLAGGMAVCLLHSTRAFAQGGPPLITDDPDTPGPGYWEINVAAERDSQGTERRSETPRLDV